MPIRAVLLAVMLLVGLRGEAEWTPEVSLQVQGVSGVVPSPDGALVVYTQTRNVVETERSESISQVWLAGADGASRRQLTVLLASFESGWNGCGRRSRKSREIRSRCRRATW